MSSGEEMSFSPYQEPKSATQNNSFNDFADNGLKTPPNQNGFNSSYNHESNHIKQESNHISKPAKDSHHHSSSKNKEKSHHSSSSSNHKHSSSSNHHKSDSSKHRDKSSNHHKLSSNGDSSISKKEHSSKSKDSSSSKHKSSRDGDKHKSHDKHKSSSGDADKHKSKSDSDKHKSSSDKHKSDSSSKHKSSSSDKHRKEGDKHHHHKSKHKDKSSKDSSSKDKHRGDNELKIKSENSFPQPAEIIQEKPYDNNELKIKEEPISQVAYNSPPQQDEENINDSIKSEVMSEDDIPLSARKIKREREEESEDDEPLSIRAAKSKKSKKEKQKKKSKYAYDSEEDDYEEKPKSKKRKKPESDYEDEEEVKPKKSSKKMKRDSESDFDDEPKSAKKSSKKVKKEPESDFDEDVKPKKSAKKAKKEPPASQKGSPKKRGKVKEEEQDVWKWWEEEKMDDGQKWRTLSHKGPVFAPPYEPLPHNVKFYYNGKHMTLTQDTEEVCGFYARMIDHDYVTKESFNKNFLKDWRKVMSPKEKDIITDLSKCNFKEIDLYYKQKSEERKAMTKEEKQAIKKKNEELVEEYGFCIIDSHKQKIGNFRIEPPGLFRGRGEHPKMGMLKKRVFPEDIIINLGKEAPIPEPPAGHKWKEVRHDNTVTWLASWNENILGQTKYIMLNPSSKLKGEKDWQKYETARKLKSRAPKIREDYEKDWKSKEMKNRQRSVALYFIDKLALRAGNEKEEGETADTVGCCSLRVEHIKLHKEKNGKQHVVDFDFLGKDSIRYENSVCVEKQVFKNLKLFMENKKPADDLFDRLNTTILNKHLTELMEGLTAKVFRTYNASKTLQEQLDILTKEDMSLPEKLLAYNRANRAVAILCNHQRSIPKTFDKQMENLQKKIEDKEEQINEVRKELKQISKSDRALYDKKKKRLQNLEDQFKKLEVQATDKEENKQIALGTSKLNYLDPRISIAWCKKWEVPIEKIYNKTQRDKFRWAIEMATPDYKF